MSKKYENIHAYRGLKVAVTVKISAHSELQNKNEKSNRAQTPCRNKIPNRNSNLFKPKWVKLGTLLKIPETKLKIQSLVTARAHTDNPKIKTTGLTPIKRFLYSHVARLTYLLSRWLE